MPFNILIGHSDKESRYELKKLLSAQKYVVTEADNGGALFTLTKAHHPNLVIVADDLSSMDIETFLKKKAELQLDEIYVIVVVNKKSQPNALKLLGLGASEVLADPLDKDELLFHIARLKNPFKPLVENAEASNGLVHSGSGQDEVTVYKKESENKSKVVFKKPQNSSLLAREALCRFCGNPDLIGFYTLRTRTVLVEMDMFDSPVYVKGIGDHEFCDYNLIDVCVCPNCFFASNDIGHFDIQGSSKQEEDVGFNEFIFKAFQKDFAKRKKIINGASPDFFNENRSEEDAFIANKLAVHALSFLYKYDKHKFSWAMNEIFQYSLKVGGIAGRAKINDVRNAKYVEAYKLGLQQMPLIGEIGVRRHTIQMLALCNLINDKKNVSKYGKDLFKYVNPESNNPQIRIKTREYVDRAKKLWNWKEDPAKWA